VADDDGRPEPKRIDERRHVGCEIARAVARYRGIRVTVPPLRQGERMNRRGQMRQHSLEGAPRVSHTMQEKHGNAGGLSLLDIGKIDSIRKRNGLDEGRHLRAGLSHARTDGQG
jgi:hypothetical protein